MSKAWRRTLVCTVGVTTMSLAVAACGSGSGDGGDSSDPVQIGLIEPMSGPFADNGTQADRGASLCVDQINADGGIKALDGAKLELRKQDTGAAQPAQVANQAQSLIDSNDLSAMIGAWASSYTLAVAPVTEQNQVPLVTESFADDIVAQGYTYVFKIPAPASEMGKQGVIEVLNLADASDYPIERAAVVAENTSSAQVSAKAAVAQLEENGVSVTNEEYFAPGLTDANSLAIKVLSGKPQFLFAQAGLADMKILQEALVRQGYTGPILGSGSALVNPRYAETVGKPADGVFTSAGWNWDLPGAEQFVEDFVAKNSEFDFPGQEAGEDCVAVYAIAAALEAAGSRDPSDVRDALAQVDISDGTGSMVATGRTKFEENGQLVDATPVIVQWQDGKPRTVFPKDVATAEPAFVK
ncbi:ABC transporter substrate-binding protein [Phycicoccus endophyticus]|uniref:ABC transporter substrate-binding protein n=1 Tax=Phycicoccus endophyticus TaxID=1690220 RepID=A0A7G9QZC9_9MICO|nr:ABC transporter substrate-binding protein [Phycicoccus endophyticus]NHI19060.1 ABC transporter substrate-binding protein [Phycicoccus endophyticus]QNN48704.1 ABC transporter substrate-binding protein [Phycicoccus endophyticus]GGL32540.1 branched-chain amino acid ABC transporter substrate-binding protein [Phycicoccus endophyticus]